MGGLRGCCGVVAPALIDASAAAAKVCAFDRSPQASSSDARDLLLPVPYILLSGRSRRTAEDWRGEDSAGLIEVEDHRSLQLIG